MNTTQENTNNMITTEQIQAVTSIWSWTYAIENKVREEIAAFEKSPVSLHHELVHGNGNAKKWINRVMFCPLGTVQGKRFHSRFYILKRVNGGVVSLVGYCGKDTFAIDIVSLHTLDFSLSHTMHCKGSAHNSIQREHRDSVPVTIMHEARRTIGLLMQDLYNGEASISTLLEYPKTANASTFIQSWINRHVHNGPHKPSPVSDYTEWLKNDCHTVGITSEEERLMSLERYHGNRSQSYNSIENFKEGIFTSNRHCDVEMEWESAKEKVRTRENFPTQWGVFRFGTEVATCGCHRFLIHDLEVYFGLRERVKNDDAQDNFTKFCEGRKLIEEWRDRAYVGTFKCKFERNALFRALKSEAGTRMVQLWDSTLKADTVALLGEAVAGMIRNELEREGRVTQAMFREIKAAYYERKKLIFLASSENRVSTKRRWERRVEEYNDSLDKWARHEEKRETLSAITSAMARLNISDRDGKLIYK